MSYTARPLRFVTPDGRLLHTFFPREDPGTIEPGMFLSYGWEAYRVLAVDGATLTVERLPWWRWLPMRLLRWWLPRFMGAKP